MGVIRRSDERDWFFQSILRSRLVKISLDIETGIETFRIAVMILRPVLRLSGLQSWYRDWYRDFQDCSLDIETGIKTLRIAVLISWLVSRLSGLQSWYQNLFLFEAPIETSHFNPYIETGTKTLKITNCKKLITKS